MPVAPAPSLFREALELLDVRNFVFAIQEPSLPGEPDEDLGRGALGSRGTAALFATLAAQGFNGIQLGPMGITSEGNPSPYDSTLFSRSPLGLSLPGLAELELLAEGTFESLLRQRPSGHEQRVPYAFVHQAYDRVLEIALERAKARPELVAETQGFLDGHRDWLVRDALWTPLVARHGSHRHEEWADRRDAALWKTGDEERLAELEREHREAIRRHALEQWLVCQQHTIARARCASLGLKLYGDLQIGVSNRDAWGYSSLFLESYRMGAPPSRTNPEGQPWNYPVLDPARFGTREQPGSALRFVDARMRRMLHDFDSVRIDHPHGWVCPWVYRANTPDPLSAVQNGARLFESPALADHPELARYARVTPEQLELSQPRHADHRVRQLTPAQVDDYAILIDVIIEAARDNGRQVSDLICEVLSTLPLPLQRVMERHGLGRFRVLQKASLTNPDDVYRSENARPEDWVMIGNHDTPSIWALITRWEREGTLADRAASVASRLVPEGDRQAFTRHLLERPGRLAHAMLADALASPARNTMLFFSDLFGIHEPYNVPGTVDPANWTLRLMSSRVASHEALAQEDRALDLRRAIGWALRARDVGAEIRGVLLAS